MKFLQYLKWLKHGKPYVTYSGYNCGLCGSWNKEEIRIPKYKSLGEWWDTWGICLSCAKINKEE